MSAPLTVRLWQIDLARAPDTPPGLLSVDEEARAARLVAPDAARQFRCCRAALRRVLATVCGRAPDTLAFRYNRYGKPELAPGQIPLPPHFNVSHSGTYALIALASAPLGVDLETYERPGVAGDELVDLVCHPHEQAALSTLSAASRTAYFYRLWTQKEAYCKALGVGLQQPLPQLLVRPGEHAGVAEVANSADSTCWWVHELAAPAGYTASLCVPTPDVHLENQPPLT